MKSSMLSFLRSHRSKSSSSQSDESTSHSKRSSTVKHRNSIDMPKHHELEEGEVEQEKPTPPPDQKKHSQGSPSETHDSWNELSPTKHGSMETKNKFSNKQNPEDEVKYEVDSSSKASKWEDDTCIKDAPKRSSLKRSSSIWDDENEAKDAQKSSNGQPGSWTSDDVKTDLSRNSGRWDLETNTKDAKKLSSRKHESSNSREAKTNRSYTKDSHRSSSSRHRSSDVVKSDHGTIHMNSKKSSCSRWSPYDSKKIDSDSSMNATKRGYRNSTGSSSLNDSKWSDKANAVDATKASGSQWNAWDSNKSNSDANISSTQKWSSWDSKESNVKSTLDDKKHVAETNAKDVLTLSVPKWDSGDSNEAKTDPKWDSCNLKEANTDSIWDKLTAKTKSKDVDVDKWGSWDTNESKTNSSWNDANESSRSNRESWTFSPRHGGSKASTERWNSRRSNTKSTMEDTKRVAETNAKDAMTTSVPKWDSGNSNGTKTDSKWDSFNLKESNTGSSRDRLAAESNTKSMDADKWGSRDTNESKTNSSWNDANKSSRSNRESLTFSPRHGSSKASTECWNSRRSNTKSTMEDTKRVAETSAKDAMTTSVPKWDTGNSNGTKTDSKWDSCNLKESNADSKWDRSAAEIDTKSKDEDKWGSWDTNENKANSSRNNANKLSDSNQESWTFSPRHGGSRTSTEDWNSRRSKITSRDDSKWRRDRHYDRYSSGKHSSYNDRSYDDIEPRRRTWSDSKHKDLGFPTTTANKDYSRREKIDEKSHDKFIQNLSELGRLNDTKDFTHSVSTLSFAKWGDPTTENEGASSSTLPWKCSKWDTQEDSNSKKVTVLCPPNNATKTPESRNVHAMNNEVSAPILSGTYVPNSEEFENELMTIFGCHSSDYTIELQKKAKSITHYWPKPIDSDPPQFEIQAAARASNVLVQSFGTAGASKNNETIGISGTKIVEEANEDKGILMFQSKIADFAEDILRPHWNGGHLKEEEHNTIVKKVVNKVMITLEHKVISDPEKYTDLYISCNRIKLTHLVAAYLENLERAKMAKTTMKPANIP